MIYLFLIIFTIAYICSVIFRITVQHPIKVIKNAIVDILKYIRYKRWNEGSFGQLIAFTGLFGKGKTLSAVHWIVNKYNRYNNKRIFDFSRMKWIDQKVHIISNVELTTVPYVPFTSLQQMIDVAEFFKKYDQENDCRTLIYFLGDEFSVQLNSRSFKTNIDPLFLNTLLTCRHHHISLIYTAQRFSHVDALLRQVTSFVVTCDKRWRYMVHGQYDAFQLENASDPTLVTPLKKFGWFVQNKDFAQYDTLACVDNLTKKCIEKDFISEDEILQFQRPEAVNMDAVVNPSKKYRKIQKKMRG